MSGRPFHLSWFTDCYGAPGWNTRWEGSSSVPAAWAGAPGFYVEQAQALERAKFDFMMFADQPYIPESFGGSSEVYFKLAVKPTHDPAAIIPVIASYTSRIGLGPTLTTTEWAPFQLARYMSTLDHLSNGRSAWNIVTGSNDLAAKNYGFDAQPGHDERYDMADEFIEITKKLWDSWEPDAVVMDRERGYYVDHTKVHTIDYVGKYYSCRGPATTLPCPQGRPILLQAGSSPRGRAYAARHADVVLADATRPESFKKHRDEVRKQAVELGRDPDSIKVFGIVQPVLGDTDRLARERAMHYDAENEAFFESNLATMGSHWAIDLSKFDPNEPLPADLTTNGHSGPLEEAIASGKTLRQLLGGVARSESELRLVGSPETVAAELCEMMDEVGGDGLMLYRVSMDRRFIAEVADGLIPALQRRGRTREEYSGTTLREHLFEF